MNRKNARKKTSSTRLQLLKSSEALSELLANLIKTKSIIKGTIYDQKRGCGNKNCKCARGELHSTKVLSFSHNGRTRLVSLAKYSLLEFSRTEKHVQDYQQFRRVRAKIVYQFKLILAQINELEKGLLIEVAPKKGGNSVERKRRYRRNQEGISPSI